MVLPLALLLILPPTLPLPTLNTSQDGGAELGNCSLDALCLPVAGSQCDPPYSSLPCTCPSHSPVRLLGPGGCSPSQALDSPCQWDQQCYTRDPHSQCSQMTDTWGFCRCRVHFEKLDQPNYSICVKVGTPLEDSGSLLVGITPGVGLCTGLSILTLLLCLVLRLFARTNQATRGFADAAAAPTIKLEGKELCKAERDTWSQTSSKSRTYSPGPPLTPTDLRKMSLLSSLSMTVPLGQDFSLLPVSPSRSSQQDDLFTGQGEESIEQTVTIIPHLGHDSRRKSMADYAFPELHPETALRKGSRNLLIYTRTRTDSLGRRESVAVPLIPSQPSSGQGEAGTNLLTIERKTSVRSRRVSRTMESIREGREEGSGREASSSKPVLRKRSAPPNLASAGMATLTVPILGEGESSPLSLSPSSPRQHLQSSPLPQASTQALPSRRHSVRSPRRSSKQEFFQFLDLAIAH